MTLPYASPDPASPTVSLEARVDRGFTLVEAMVAISILSVLMVMLTTTIVKGMQLSRNMGARLENINQGQIGMNAATKALRTAILPDQLVDSTCVGCRDTALFRATATGVTFYANLNNTGQGPTRTAYDVEQDPRNGYASRGNLIQTTWAPQTLSDGRYSFCDVATPGCVGTRRAVTRGLSWPATPVFGYYDFDGVALPPGTLTDAELARVNSIDITLKVQTNTVQSGAPTNTIVERVQLPNSDISVLVQPSGSP